jgi:hypothetical protein
MSLMLHVSEYDHVAGDECNSSAAIVEDEMILIRRAVTASLLCLCGEEKFDQKKKKTEKKAGSIKVERGRFEINDRDDDVNNSNCNNNENKTTTTTTTTTHHQHHDGAKQDNDSWREILVQAAHKTISRTTTSSSNNTSNNNNNNSSSSSSNNSTIDGKPWDFEVRTAPALFHRFKSLRRCRATTRRCPLSATRREGKDDDDEREQEYAAGSSASAANAADDDADTVVVEPPPPPTYYWQITSDMGLIRTIYSPVELATLLGLLVEQELEQLQFPGCDVRVALPSGFLLIVSPRRQRALRLAGRLPCRHCPMWLKGEKGLWWHEQEQHGTDHAIATATAASMTQRATDALVLYDKKNVPNCYTTNTNTNNININDQRQLVLQQQQQSESGQDDDKPDVCNDDDTTEKEKQGNGSSSSIRISIKSSSSNSDPFQQAANGDLEGLKCSIALAKKKKKKNHATAELDVVTAVDQYGSCVLLWYVRESTVYSSDFVWEMLLEQ